MHSTSTLPMTLSNVIIPIASHRHSVLQDDKLMTCLGMIGAYHERTVGLYRREIKSKRFVNPYRNDFQFRDHIEQLCTLAMLNESCAIDQSILAYLRCEIKLMASGYDLKKFTVASCGLEKFIPKLSLEFDLPAIFPSDHILHACQKAKILQITLLGNKRDTASSVPLVCRLRNIGIEVILPEAETMKKLISLTYGIAECDNPYLDQLKSLTEPHLMKTKSIPKLGTARPTIAQLEQAEIIAAKIATKSQAVLIMSPELDWLCEVMQEYTMVLSSFKLHSQAIKIALGP